MAKAAVTRSIRDDHQKNFLKIFNSLTGKHSRWEIWEDFVTLTAIEISNSTDKVNAPERTKMYQTIVSKYSAKEREGMVEMLAEVIMGMEQNPDQDFLGSLSIRSVKIRLTCTNLAIRKPRMPATRRGRPQEPPSSLRENSLPLLRSSCTSCAGTS